jgi:uncharacterized NAD(P)/FAD-binding protein YdhS
MSAGTIAIVGGGASGVIMAAHLLRSRDPALRVILIEKREAFGQGIAYSTSLPDHLLNVSAMGMSALADDPEHFARWVAREGLARHAPGSYYAPRSVYGRYLREVLDELARREPERLRLVRETVISVTPTRNGVDIGLANGASIAARRAVIAAGHDEEPSPEQTFAVRIGSREDAPIDRDARVMILGSGLSMVDAWLTLEHRGHSGEILAVSRRGLLPSPHHAGKPIRLDSADIPLGTELSYFVRWFRDLVRATERAGGNWRDVVDGIRPFNQRIWQNWPVTAKRRFLHHTKAWWDIHRHRMAPAIHRRLSQAVESGNLRLLAGRVLEAQPSGGGLAVTFQRRQSQAVERIEVARIYDCTGIVKDVSTGSIAVVRSLTDRGYARPDPLRLGLDVTTDCALIDADGTVSGKLYAVGPLTRGVFFEIDAVPDIRTQCARLATTLTEEHGA